MRPPELAVLSVGLVDAVVPAVGDVALALAACEQREHQSKQERQYQNSFHREFLQSSFLCLHRFPRNPKKYLSVKKSEKRLIPESLPCIIFEDKKKKQKGKPI